MYKKITPEQTSELFSFCQQKDVEYYDLQIELVDHMASYIETQWQTRPDVPFKNLLSISFAKFGAHGFNEIKKTKEKELKRKYNHLHRLYILQFFSWPKIILTILLTLTLFSAFRILHDYRSIYIAYFSAASFLIGYFYIYYSPQKLKLKSIDNTKFMLLEYYKKVKKQVPYLALLPINFINIFAFDLFPINPLERTIPAGFLGNAVLFTIALAMVLFGISLYSFTFFIPLKIKEHFIAHYSEFIK